MENKMKQVAQMFGKKLDEEFMARLKVGFEINCKFTNEGLKQEIVDGDWYDNDNFLRRLLIGEAEIVENEEDEYLGISVDELIDKWFSLLDSTYDSGPMDIDDRERLEMLTLLRELKHRRERDGK